MKFLVLVALLGCVVADPEADPALYYSSGIYSGLGYGHGLGYAGYGHGLHGYASFSSPSYGYSYGLPAYGYSLAHGTPVTHTVSTTSYSYPAWTGYHGCHFGLHGCHVATVSEPVINLKGEPAEGAAVEEARKKREADPEADPSFYYASFSSPSYGYSYGLHSGHAGYAGHGYAGHGYAGLGYAGLGYAGLGYAGLGYAGHGYAGHGYAGLGYAGHGYAGYHGLPRTYLGRYY